MERRVDVATGESVAFSYELAGLGSRFFAVFLDMALQVLVVIVIALLLLWIASSSPEHGKAVSTPSKIADGIVTAVFVFGGFVLFFGYFIFFEWRLGGRTPGKRLLGIRVVRDGGFPLDFTASVVRNVVRILELGLGFYAVSAVVSLVSPENRRLGDMAAGTIVVRDHAFERTGRPFALRDDEPDDALVRDLTPGQRELVRRYYERRDSLGLEARRIVAGQIAAGIRPKLAASFEHIDDDHLLVHLATTALS